MDIWIINGPNLNLLGKREKSVYGDASFESYLETLRARYPHHTIHYYQSNVEGELINQIHACGFSPVGIVLNAGAYTHTSIALSDAIRAVPALSPHVDDCRRLSGFDSRFRARLLPPRRRGASRNRKKQVNLSYII